MTSDFSIAKLVISLARFAGALIAVENRWSSPILPAMVDGPLGAMPSGPRAHSVRLDRRDRRATRLRAPDRIAVGGPGFLLARLALVVPLAGAARAPVMAGSLPAIQPGSAPMLAPNRNDPGESGRVVSPPSGGSQAVRPGYSP